MKRAAGRRPDEQLLRRYAAQRNERAGNEDMLTKLQEAELLAVTVIDGRDPNRTFRIAPGMVEAVHELV